MQKKNMCKFIPARTSITLDVHNFIHETPPPLTENEFILPHNRAILISSGNGTLTFDTRAVSVSKGALVFAFSGERFSADGDSEFQYMYISFTGEYSDELFRRFGISKELRRFDDFDGVIPLWLDTLMRASEENIDLSATSMLLYTFSRLTAGQTKNNDIINSIISLSEDCFTESDLSITKIADSLGYNAKYLSHIFKSKMSVGYSEYLRNLRIKYAVSLFDHGIDSVKNVALLSGFQDPLYFSSVFKKVVGLSPAQYIDRLSHEE